MDRDSPDSGGGAGGGGELTGLLLLAAWQQPPTNQPPQQIAWTAEVRNLDARWGSIENLHATGQSYSTNTVESEEAPASRRNWTQFSATATGMTSRWVSAVSPRISASAWHSWTHWDRMEFVVDALQTVGAFKQRGVAQSVSVDSLRLSGWTAPRQPPWGPTNNWGPWAIVAPYVMAAELAVTNARHSTLELTSGRVAVDWSAPEVSCESLSCGQRRGCSLARPIWEWTAGRRRPTWIPGRIPGWSCRFSPPMPVGGFDNSSGQPTRLPRSMRTGGSTCQTGPIRLPIGAVRCSQRFSCRVIFAGRTSRFVDCRRIAVMAVFLTPIEYGTYRRYRWNDRRVGWNSVIPGMSGLRIIISPV